MRLILVASALLTLALARPGLPGSIDNLLSGALPEVNVFECGQERPYGLCCQARDGTNGKYCEEASSGLALLGAGTFSCDKDYSNQPTQAFCCGNYKTNNEIYGSEGMNCEPQSTLGGTIAKKE